VRRSNELEVLRAALDSVDQGVILLDPQFNAQFMNRSVRELFGVPDAQADRKPSYAELVNDARATKYGVPPGELDAFISRRIAAVSADDPAPFDLPMRDGRTIRSQCTRLADGHRVLTYTDVTDLVRNAEELTRLATIDGMSGVYNRGPFQTLAEAEWSRFQRYHRPLSLLLLDIDQFKTINDRFGHDAGDSAIVHISRICSESKRSPDILGRVGGDEFAVLLPETTLTQAEIMAERIRRIVEASPLAIEDAAITVTVSIGAAEATLSQATVASLMKLADRSLYQAKAAGRNQVARAVDKPIAGYRAAAE
jgi:diguanylate cyclase (GGDEF)-like protein